MAGDPLVRNSRILGIFSQIVHGPQGTLRAVGIAGRGIVAEVRCTLSALDGKVGPVAASGDAMLEGAIEYADLLTELGAIEVDLAELWRRRRAEDIDDAAFEGALRDIVLRLEEWPTATE